MNSSLELELSEENGQAVLRAPEVGYFTCALPRGAVVAPGETAGVLSSLGRAFVLRVPEGATGEVVSDPPDRVHAPVGFRDVLYRLAPIASARGTSAKAVASTGTSSGGLVLRAPQSGRFYHRPAPSEPAFVVAGSTLKDGAPVGMIEVMKTFSHVPYRATGGLPASAKVVRLIARDGADVRAGDPLLEVEPEA